MKGQGPAPDGYQPPRGVTRPAEEVRRPSEVREELLPLVDVGSESFEKLCRGVIGAAFPELVRSSLKRRRGQKQFGVDVEGFDSTGDTAVVISAKCYHEICARAFRPWIVDFTKHLDGPWKGKGVRTFVLAVTHETKDDEMNASAKALVTVLKNRGIEFRLWNAHTISNLLAADPILVRRYLSKYWVD